MTERAAVKALVAEQAADEGLWFIAQTAPEAYLQQALRRLHAAIEGDGYGGTRVRWNEPGDAPPGEPAPNVVQTLTVPQAIAAQRAAQPSHPYTDAEALDDFLVVHWAWLERPNGEVEP